MDTFNSEIGLLQIALDALTRMVGARYGAMHIFNGRVGTTHFLYTGIRKEEASRLASEAPPKGFGLLGSPLEQGQVMRLEVVTKDQRQQDLTAQTFPRMKRLLGIPLAAKGKVYGLVYLAEKAGGGPFTEEDEHLALTMSFQVASAIESSRLKGRLREQLEALQGLSREFANERNPEHLLQQVVNAATTLIGADYGVLAICNAEGRITQLLTSGLTPEECEKITPLPQVRGFLEEVWRNGETIRLDQAFGLAHPHPPVQGLLAMRIRSREETLGSLCLTKKSGSFTTEDEQILVALLAHAANAIQNTRLFAAIADEVERWEGLYRLACSLSRPLDMEQIYPAIAGTVKTYLHFDRIGVVVPQGEELVMVMSVAEPPVPTYKGKAWPRTGETAVEWVLTHGQPRLIRDLALDQAFADEAFVAREGIRSTLMVPLQTNGERFGVLVLDSRSLGAYEQRDLQLLAPLAERLAVAFQNRRTMEELRQALEELKATQEQLVRGETHRTLGELASGTAHHLNNALAIVVGRVQVLRMTVDDPAMQQSLEIIEQAAMDGAETVRRLQSFARPRPTQAMVQLDLVRIAEESLEFTRSRWLDEARAKGIQIELQLEFSQVPPISGQAFELREVVTNLILNAVDAMPKGGRITLKTWSERPWVFLSVSDTGVGMSEEARRRAFEPFFSTKGPSRTGLGLSVAYGIVQRHSGEIAIESAEGKGTTVTVRLRSAPERGLTQSEGLLRPPAGGRPMISSPSVAQPGSPAPPHAARILVIDDEVQIRLLLSKILTTEGHTVTQAAEGSEGLALLEDSPYDLVITDLGMPGMTGWQVAEAVKVRRPGTPVVLVTGWGDTVEPDAMAEHGVQALLCKPFGIEALRSLVARLLKPASKPE